VTHVTTPIPPDQPEEATTPTINPPDSNPPGAAGRIPRQRNRRSRAPILLPDSTAQPDPITPDAAGQDARGDENPYRNLPGHPMARGTLPMARYLTDLETEDEIQALAARAATAPPLTPELAARLARMLRLTRRPIIDGPTEP
jgi:hypothetical protein